MALVMPPPVVADKVQPAVIAPEPAADPAAATSCAPEPRPLGKLARMMQLRGLRPRATPVADRNPDDPAAVPPAPQDMAGQAAASAGAATTPSILPRDVSDMGWAVRGLPVSHGGADHWPVQRQGEHEAVHGVFRLLPSGSLTPPVLYRRLLNAPAPCPHRARLWQHGTTDRGHGIRADYELLSIHQGGTELASWLRDTPPGEARALSLLPALQALLQALQAEGVAPLVLEPGMLARLDSGRLCLSRLWALTDAPEGDAAPVQRYRPEFQRTLLLPVPWAAPELSASQVESANAAVFSVGQLLACALWGQPATHQELRTGLLRLQAIQHAGLARLLQLCLWHLPEGRATPGQLLAALAAPDDADRMPAAPAWASLMPGAAGQAFLLAGTSHWRLEDLMAAAVQSAQWDEATRQVESILDWAGGTAWAGTAALLLDGLRQQGRSADWVLMQLARRVRPHAPATWRRLDLSDAQAVASLVNLAQGALAGTPDDMELVQRLFQADLRGALLTETIHTGPH